MRNEPELVKFMEAQGAKGLKVTGSRVKGISQLLFNGMTLAGVMGLPFMKIISFLFSNIYFLLKN